MFFESWSGSGSGSEDGVEEWCTDTSELKYHMAKSVWQTCFPCQQSHPITIHGTDYVPYFCPQKSTYTTDNLLILRFKKPAF